MAVAIDVREWGHRPVWSGNTVTVVVPANAGAGTAEDLIADLLALNTAINSAYMLWISNNSGADAWIRTTAAGASTGILIPDGGNVTLPIEGPQLATLFLENSGNVDVGIFPP